MTWMLLEHVKTELFELPTQNETKPEIEDKYMSKEVLF
jgi:hypothetical protein